MNPRLTPLEPLPELYAALRRMKNNGEDMSRVALRLMADLNRAVRRPYSSTYLVTPNSLASWSLAAMLSSLWYQI